MNKEKNYEICWLQICSFEIDFKIGEKKVYKPDRENYPYRICVLDKNKKEAIDVFFEQKYDYIETSSIYFLGNEASKIEEDKRYACLKLPLNLKKFSSEELNVAMQVMLNYKHGTIYPDGNLVSNEEYLKRINNDNICPKEKIKRI